MSTRRLFVAVRDLDPPGGGAERSLAALLNGIAVPGPTLETAPIFVPMLPSEVAATHPAWAVSAFASHDRGNPIGLLEPEVKFETTDLSIEGFWSKLAWGLRERKGELRRRKWALDRHIAKRSSQFAGQVGSWLDKHDVEGGIGLTQLDWAPRVVVGAPGACRSVCCQRDALRDVRSRRYAFPPRRTISSRNGGSSSCVCGWRRLALRH